MRAIGRTTALLEVLLVAPAMLFMAALFLRSVQPLLGADHVVTWFARHLLVGLYLFLFAMPLAALLAGSSLLLHAWRSDSDVRRGAVQMLAILRTHPAIVLIAASTLAAAGVLAIVALHLITE